mmetsp:Transcript_30942/g.79889  ORF Transcript_30942/g.79889 Transcript_30942/m.79889 type:complete len:129 (-) Transcript_30942:52-438(-)
MFTAVTARHAAAPPLVPGRSAARKKPGRGAGRRWSRESPCKQTVEVRAGASGNDEGGDKPTEAQVWEYVKSVPLHDAAAKLSLWARKIGEADPAEVAAAVEDIAALRLHLEAAQATVSAAEGTRKDKT